jgi:hypothetical protein
MMSTGHAEQRDHPMARKPSAPSPMTFEQKRREVALAVAGLWQRFRGSEAYSERPTAEQRLLAFAAGVTRDVLFCQGLSPRDPRNLAVDDIVAFFEEGVPRHVLVDEVGTFIDACCTWLLWLTRHVVQAEGRKLERVIRGGRQAAVAALTRAGSSPAKELIAFAMLAGVDPGNPRAVIEHCSTRGFSRDYCEEFLDPPSAVAVYVGGRRLYQHDWPPPAVA